MPYTSQELFDALNRDFTSVVNDRPYVAHGHATPLAAIVKIYEYGFQRIVNDKCGGNDKDATLKDKIATATIARILDGSIAHRRIGATSTDPMDVWRDRAALALIKAHAPQILSGKKGDDRAEAIDAFAAKNAALVESTATQLRDESRRMADAIKSLDVAITL